MTITRCQTERPITSNEHSNLTISLKRHLGKGELTEAQIEKLRRCDFPFESIKEAVGLDDRLRAIWDSEQNGAPDSLELQINDGDHEDISDGDSYELGEYENSEEALAAAEAFISTHGNEVNDEEDGIGSVIYWTVEVERRVEYKENEWLPCDESGRIDDGYGNEPNATVAYLSSLEGSREERAFELAKNEYLAWLEHKADRYTTVYGYMD